MENILFFTLLLVLAEVFEVVMFRASTLFGVLEKLYVYYQKTIFLFFLVQPSFYVVFFIVLATGVLNASMIFLLALKVFDLFYKMTLMKQIFIEKEVSSEIAEVLEWKMPKYFVLMGLGMYPPLLFLALV